MKAIIIDDESKQVSTLQKIITDYCDNITIIDVAYNIKDAKESIVKKSPDLIFLDIEMPFGNAFDLLNSFEDIFFEIIFTTAHQNYAISAFKFPVIDYLLKPINISELKNAIAKAQKRILEKRYAQNYLYDKLNKPSPPQIIFSEESKQHIVKAEEIMYCIADGSYTSVYLIGNKKIFLSKNIGEVECFLPEYLFFRIHRGYIVNITHITRLKKSKAYSVIMTDNKELEVAKRRKSDFLTKFIQ